MTARPASLENALALHRLNCVDCLSSFGDTSVASLGNILWLSATGKFAFFPYAPVFSSRLRAVCPFHLPCRNVLTTAVLTRDAAKVRCSTYLRLASVGCSKNVILAERSLERPSCFFSFFFFLLNHAFTRSSCLACEGFPEETIL